MFPSLSRRGYFLGLPLFLLTGNSMELEPEFVGWNIPLKEELEDVEGRLAESALTSIIDSVSSIVP